MSAVWNVHRVSSHLQRPSLCVSWLRKVNSELSLSRRAGRQNPQLGPNCLRAALICDICCVMKRLIAPLIIAPIRHFDSLRLEVAHPQIFMYSKIPALTKTSRTKIYFYFPVNGWIKLNETPSFPSFARKSVLKRFWKLALCDITREGS